MKPTMIAAIAAMSLAGLAPAAAQDRERGEDMVLRLFGTGSWSVECTLETDRGRTSRPEARGRGNSASGTILGRDVLSGSCAAEASDRGPLELTLVDDDRAFACPFGDRTGEGTCFGVLQAGETLEWTVERS